MSDWQKIETAPKDGTNVLLFFGNSDSRVRVSEAWWDGRAWTDDIGGFVEQVITHWMPLPPQPEAHDER